MRPLSLEMTNIGPFVNRTTVDLTGIEEGGLFLVSGPTGSGKSFIFDTMCYALYGKTPSGREGNLKSDHAAAGEEPLISFGFALGEKEYLVERRLEYEASKRGGGTTTRPETASLVQIMKDGSTRTLASKKTDVKDRCCDLLGLGMEQFSRVMMIPQGEFRELLRAETRDRETLLRKLFDSRLFFDISDELSKMYGRLSDELKGARAKNDTRIETIVSKIGSETSPGEGLTFEKWADLTLGDLEKQMSDSLSEAVKADARWKEAKESLDRMKKAYDTRRSFEEAKKRLDSLKEKGTGEIEPLIEKVELSRKAGYLREDLGKMDELLKARDRCREDLASGKDALEKAKEELTSARNAFDREVPEKEKELDKGREKLAALRDARPKVSELEEILKRIGPLRKELEKERKRRTSVEEKKERIDLELKDIAEETEGLPSEKDIYHVRTLEKTGEDLIGILKRNEKLRRRLDEMGSDMESRKERMKRAELSLSDLRRRRESSMAGELAASLKEGEECPVCGSVHHPRPRERTEEDVTLDMIRSSEAELSSARESLGSLEEERTELLTRSAELEGRSSDIRREYPDLDLPTDELEALADRLSAKVSEMNSAERRKEELSKKVRELSGEDRELGEELRKLSSSLEEKSRDFALLEARAGELSRPVEELSLDTGEPSVSLVRALKDLERRTVEIRDLIDRMQKDLAEKREAMAKAEGDLSSCMKRSSSAGERVSEQERLLGKRMEEVEGFSTIEDLRKAILPEERERAITITIDRHRKEVSGLEGRIAELDRDLEKMGKVPDEEELDRAAEGEEELGESWKKLHGRCVKLENDLEWAKEQLEAVRSSRKKMKEKEEEISVVGKLAMQVKGNGIPRISLERFFLSQRFEEVLISSNQRLKVLSGGRFLLRRAGEEDRSARARGGLDINVYDNHTGQERPANTLSGGQMFLSSLALALGLADVVQSRSGGIRMDTLLIDEGFGSLDEETLQTALKVLSELRQGRMVGVISHVGELKRQIRTGFEVVPSPSGSTIKNVGL